MTSARTGTLLCTGASETVERQVRRSSEAKRRRAQHLLFADAAKEARDGKSVFSDRRKAQPLHADTGRCGPSGSGDQDPPLCLDRLVQPLYRRWPLLRSREPRHCDQFPAAWPSSPLGAACMDARRSARSQFSRWRPPARANPTCSENRKKSSSRP